jgi:hypothetical protein
MRDPKKIPIAPCVIETWIPRVTDIYKLILAWKNKGYISWSHGGGIISFVVRRSISSHRISVRSSEVVTGSGSLSTICGDQGAVRRAAHHVDTRLVILV